MRIAVMVSGGGSNLQSLIDDANKCYEIALVISDREKAFGLERAEIAGIANFWVGKKNFGENKNVEILRLLKEYKIDAIVLAGYLSIIPESIVSAYEHKIINIHPSLIPSFCGMGFHGHHVHEAVYESGVKLSGATVHFVNTGVDTGEIILQESVPLDNSDTPETIAAKVLKIEHSILPKAVNLFAQNNITIKNKRTYIQGESYYESVN